MMTEEEYLKGKEELNQGIMGPDSAKLFWDYYTDKATIHLASTFPSFYQSFSQWLQFPTLDGNFNPVSQGQIFFNSRKKIEMLEHLDKKYLKSK